MHRPQHARRTQALPRVYAGDGVGPVRVAAQRNLLGPVNERVGEVRARNVRAPQVAPETHVHGWSENGACGVCAEIIRYWHRVQYHERGMLSRITW